MVEREIGADYCELHKDKGPDFEPRAGLFEDEDRRLNQDRRIGTR